MRWSGVVMVAAAALAVGFSAGRITAPREGRLKAPAELAKRALLPPAALAFPNSDAAGKIAFGSSFRREPAALLPVGPKAAVVAAFAEGTAHDDPGLVRVVYLTPTRRGWMPMPNEAASAASGLFGDAGAIVVRHDLGPTPIVQVEGGGTWQGCTSRELALIELAPDRPRVLLQGLPAARQGGADGAEFSGRIVRRADRFWIDYRGPRPMTIELRRDGDRLTPASKPPAGCQGK